MDHIFGGIGTNIIKPEDVKICVLYDTMDGHIVHTHWVVTFKGGQRVDDEEVKARAFERATAHGIDVSNLKPLHVSPDDYDMKSKYTVDLKSRTLIKA